jgi:UDP-N-acetylmuramoylalanine--D-glutamate ligase
VTLLHHLVEASGRKAILAGNIGFAVMDKLDELDADSVAVLEISCFQLTHTPSIRPQVSVFTNIAEDHVEYHGSMAAYIDAKKVLMQNQGPGDSVVVNADDPELLAWQMPAGVDRRLFGTWRPWVTAGRCWVEAQAIWLDEGRGPEKLVGAEELKIIGGHNLMNAMSAALGALALGVDLDSVRRGLRSFEGLEHRMEFVRELDGVRWYNDSKATNPHAAGAVLEALEGGIIVIAGGSEKGSDFSDLGRLIAKRTKAAVLNGGTAARIAQAIPAGHPVHLVATLGDAIAKARALASPGDLVVLAPACASFDQFKDFEHRGRVFKELVRAL